MHKLSPNVKGELDLGPATLSCRNITSYTNTKQLIDIAAMGEDGPPVGRSVTHVGESPSELEAYRQNTIVSTGAITTIVTWGQLERLAQFRDAWIKLLVVHSRERRDDR